MYRKISDKLLAWKNSLHRKPLILKGARRVGKTYSLLEFGRSCFPHVAYFNFEINPTLVHIFEGDINPDRLIPLLESVCGARISKPETLIIFDEIQLCPRALTSLKYFYELAPEYHIAAAGSLLGIAVNREEFSFPVGCVDMMDMYPMDFEEFLLALGKGDLCSMIKEHFSQNIPMELPYHNMAMDFYRQYILVGGIPLVVKDFVDNGDYILARYNQSTIIESYLSDMSKYNTRSEIEKTRLLYNNLHVQLAKENKRFQYKQVKSGGRASVFESALEWLCLSGIASKLKKIDQIKLPLKAYTSMSDFKMYVSDVGILCAMEDVMPNDILVGNKDINDFRGGLTENYVNQHLLFNGHKIYYYADRYMEIDFILRIDDDIVPIEVKSAHAQAKSLGLYLKKYSSSYGIKICDKNFGFENRIKTIPLYAVFCI